MNNTHNRIEIKFNHRPSEDIQSKMKGARFRWSRGKGTSMQRINLIPARAFELADQGEAVGEKLSYAEQVKAKRQRALAQQGRL